MDGSDGLFPVEKLNFGLGVFLFSTFKDGVTGKTTRMLTPELLDKGYVELENIYYHDHKTATTI